MTAPDLELSFQLEPQELVEAQRLVQRAVLRAGGVWAWRGAEMVMLAGLAALFGFVAAPLSMARTDLATQFLLAVVGYVLLVAGAFIERFATGRIVARLRRRQAAERLGPRRLTLGCAGMDVRLASGGRQHGWAALDRLLHGRHLLILLLQTAESIAIALRVLPSGAAGLTHDIAAWRNASGLAGAAP